jgi:hypothetical protein
VAKFAERKIQKPGNAPRLLPALSIGREKGKIKSGVLFCSLRRLAPAVANNDRSSQTAPPLLNPVEEGLAKASINLRDVYGPAVRNRLKRDRGS